MPQTHPRPRLSVIVCTYDRHEMLPDAIQSLLRQQVDKGCLEIIIVDNSPDQEKAARCRAGFAGVPGVRYLLEPTPGLSHARNTGTAHARADLVAFMDDDAVAARDWAAHMLWAFDTFAGEAGVVGGRVLPRWISDRPPWLADGLLRFLSILDWGDETRPIRAGEYLVGCNIAFDRSLLESVGGFSRSLGRSGAGLALLSNEEIEVAEKINRAGRLSVYCPAATVHHVIAPARLTRGWFRRRAAWQAVSDFIKAPQHMAAYAPAAAEHWRQALLDRSREPAAGILAATDDPQQFERDVAVAYDLVVTMLAGGLDLDGPNAPAQHARQVCEPQPG
jgi:glycosyltransferase involved in cell wall biosynthesis